MRAKFPDLDVYPEIAEFNREFIRLMLDPDAPDTEHLFGMPPESIASLAAMSFIEIRHLVEHAPRNC